MNFDLDDNQELFRATIERFCETRGSATRTAVRQATGSFDRTRWQELAGLGVLSLQAAEDDGGLGGSLVDCAVVAQALGEGRAMEPWLECGYVPVRLLGSDGRTKEVQAGSLISTLALAEPGRRYTIDAAETRSDGSVLAGTKVFVPCGADADLYLVTAISPEGDTAIYPVQRSAPGVELHAYPVADGSVAALLHLRQAPHSEPLGGDWRAVIDDARIIAAAEIVGIARRLFGDSLEYVKTREQFGQPIGRFQAIQHRLADMYGKIETIQSAVYRALLQPSAPSAAIKGFVAEEAIWLGEQAVQLHGGMGMSDELEIGHGLKRIIYLSRLFGDPASGIASYASAA